MKSALKNSYDEERILFNDTNFKLADNKDDNIKSVNHKKDVDLESDHCFSETYSFVSNLIILDYKF